LCGDTVRFAIRLREDRVVEAAFEAEACAICTAAASLLTELALGLTPEQLMGMEAAELEVALKTEIRPARKRCASLPLEAARSAVISITQPDRP
jgi:NifU-like protein involved in Fe-S cluster formation